MSECCPGRTSSALSAPTATSTGRTNSGCRAALEFLRQAGESAPAARFLAELTGTPAAGVLKAGTGYWSVTPFEHRVAVRGAHADGHPARWLDWSTRERLLSS